MEQPTVGTAVVGSEMEVDATDTSLKRLEFVKDYACWGSKRATDMYQSTKNVAPDMIKPGLDNLECKIGQFAGPLYHKFEPEVPKILNAVDSKVDETILGVWSIYSNRVLPSRPVKMAQGAYTSLLSQSEKQIEFLEQLREEYFKKIENTVDMAWTDFKDLGPVKHAIASYEPAVAAAQEKYFAALKTVTKDPRYASLVSSGTGMLQSINTSSTYQKRLAPYLSPYLSKIASSSYYTRSGIGGRGAMSWQEYVDEQLVDTGCVSSACIAGLDGVIWANQGLEITPDEVRCIVSGFEDASNLYAEGLKIGGVKHMLIKASEENIHAKKGSTGVICCKTEDAHRSVLSSSRRRGWPKHIRSIRAINRPRAAATESPMGRYVLVTSYTTTATEESRM
eukprot:jgi/Pico_ML_1/54328/g4692.t2